MLHTLNHDGTDSAGLGSLTVGGLLDLIVSTLGDTNAENAEEISVVGLGGSNGLDLGLKGK